MGRTEPSIGRPPAAFRKDARAKKAKATLNQTIPQLLSAHPRARRGIEAAELIVNPSPGDRKAEIKKSNGQAESDPPGPRLCLQVADTLTAARSLLARDTPSGVTLDLGNKNARVAILNMASPLSPGGGFLNGAGSQEESLCMRTTLLPSLKDEHYRLPEVGAIFTPDVLVFRDEEAEDVLEKKDRFFVNCITAAMLRGPEIDVNELGRGSYTHEKDRELVLQKMKMVMRICQAKGVKRLVAGAWGCGAYGNPVAEVARAWKKVLLPPRKTGKGKQKGTKETWDGVEEVMFAIKDAGMAEAFAEAFGEGLLRDEGLDADEDEEDEEVDPEEVKRQELQVKIRELEQRIEAAANPRVKEGLTSILEGLRKQLPEDTGSGGGGPDPSSEEDADTDVER
ncbi:hypothetical protein FSOLCH5_011415 [Fusarium solani]|jgi:uncharacterized protein (TIGR02452 family)|uniref:Microbial-type PARG catalytic domain-containing protein n=1 Tax=Fusarium solani TaxID=169388 RepID=A0A9P9HBK6_FUSSL|nr:uncharacterized protein B0J15DRAFT_494633 [Fusarium solani]KAH7254553.1 hypothetical protein B0J15DRAFT_494633 [Fusarium solani]KAJ4215861.1 hypothetical protein NW759_009720 [Fusarium solani]